MIRELFLVASLLAVPAFPAVEVKEGAGQIDVVVDGQPFTTFHYGDAKMKPYLAPLRTQSGKVITRHWPMESV